MNRLLLLGLTCALFASCQDQEAQMRIEELETQLDECQNGAERLAVLIETNYRDGKDSLVFELYQKIRKSHPEYPRITELEQFAIESSKRLVIQENERLKKIEASRNARLGAVKKLKRETDDVSGNTFYTTKRFTHYNNRNLVSLYIGQNSSIWLRMKASYAGDDWIFFERIYLSYDGNTREVLFNQYQDKESDNASGDVWEWVDISVENSLVSYLKNFLESENAKIRFQGKYTETRALTIAEKSAMKEVLLAYDVLTNGQ